MNDHPLPRASDLGLPILRRTAELMRVIDGDTYVLRVDLGFYVSAAIKVRLRGVDAPERNTPEGRRAIAWVIDQLTARRLEIESHKDERSFERWVCDVHLGLGGTSLAESMVRAGHAVVWSRGKPEAGPKVEET